MNFKDITEKIENEKVKKCVEIFDIVFLPQTNTDDWYRGIIFTGLIVGIAQLIGMVI